MRLVVSLACLALVPARAIAAAEHAAHEAHAVTPAAAPVSGGDEEMVKKIFTEALAHGQAFENLRALVTTSPGRLAGSKSLERAVTWAGQTLGALALDRVFMQDVMVPHWERGAKESLFLLTGGDIAPLTGVALGGSEPTPKSGLITEVTEVQSLDELATLGRDKIEGKVIFFNRPMDPALFNTGAAYGAAGDQRNRGPAAAAKYGAAGALVRSLTLAHDDVPHTGQTTFAPDQPKIPAAALSPLAADKLSAAIAAAKKNPEAKGGAVRVAMTINAQWLPEAPSHNVIGEIRGRESPDEVILVGGHLDCWDIAPGAHDDGAGVVQSIEVLRIFRALGLKPRHTIRAVLFTNEENGTRGSAAYASAAKDSANEKHLFALETDNGGFAPHGFTLGSTQFDAAARAARWAPLFEPYDICAFRKGSAGTDVTPLLVQGVTVGQLSPDSQRYFDIHHTREDSLDKVNPRELELCAAALAALIWLVDTQGL